jgi:hypothetical protein
MNPVISAANEEAAKIMSIVKVFFILHPPFVPG